MISCVNRRHLQFGDLGQFCNMVTFFLIPMKKYVFLILRFQYSLKYISFCHIAQGGLERDDETAITTFSASDNEA